ncbi:MAG: hypothetical protein AAFR35_09195 [Pseudomonadota bacterium]
MTLPAEVAFPQGVDALEAALDASRDGTFPFFGEEDKTWEEWWVLARAARLCAGQMGFPARFRAIKSEAPDFWIQWDDIQIAVEITEASGSDGQVVRALRHSSDALNHLGEGRVEIDETQNPKRRGAVPYTRFEGGVVDDEWEIATRDDFFAALESKRAKPYAEGAILICYKNSTAFPDPEALNEYLPASAAHWPFSLVVLLGGAWAWLFNMSGRTLVSS